MTEKESQEQTIHMTEEPQQVKQKKPRRRSFFQISKGQMILTKDLWLQKFKSNSAHASPPEQLNPPLSSPVELPHIEQLQPINTDISSEIQFHQQQQQETETHSPDIEKVAAEEAIEEDPKNDKSSSNSSNEDKKPQEEHEEKADSKNTQTASGDDSEVVDDPQHKDQPIVKRSSILLKFLFPKKTSSTSTEDVIVTESIITENHQAKIGAGNDNDRDSKEKIVNEQVTGNKKDTPDRPSSPLGRRINAVLSRIPTYKEKPSSGPGHANKSPSPLDNVNGVEENIKTTADNNDDDANYENEKLVPTIAADTSANHSIAAV